MGLSQRYDLFIFMFEGIQTQFSYHISGEDIE